MNDGKGTVTVGRDTLPTGACVYCGRIGEIKYGTCPGCLGKVGEILSLEVSRPSELKAPVGMSEEILRVHLYHLLKDGKIPEPVEEDDDDDDRDDHARNNWPGNGD